MLIGIIYKNMPMRSIKHRKSEQLKQGMHQDSALYMTKGALNVGDLTPSVQFVAQHMNSSQTSGSEK